MFIRVGNRIVNTDRVTDVVITQEHTMGDDDGGRRWTVPLVINVFTTGIDSEYDDGGDYPDAARVEIKPRVIRFVGDQAEEFLGALTRGRPLPPPEAWTGGSS